MKKQSFRWLKNQPKKVLFSILNKANKMEVGASFEESIDLFVYQDRILTALAYRYGGRYGGE